MPKPGRQYAVVCLGVVCALIIGSHTAAFQTSSMPSGWTDRDIGNPPIAGSAQISGDTITVRGAGADIGGKSDQFHFAYQVISGDVDVRVRVADLQDVNPGSKAGLMIRDSLTADAKHASMLLSVEQGLVFQSRTKSGRAATQLAGAAATAPAWVRLVRQGRVFKAYSSATGTTWTQIGNALISMSGSVYVGLAVTSHDPGLSATASFSNVAFGSLPAPWAAGDIGGPALAGSASESGGTFTVTGAGQDISDTADQFQFVYQPVTGDTELVAWVASLQAADALSKAGIMIREALTGSAAHASMFATGSSGWSFQRRPSAGGTSYTSPGGSGSAPGWVRLAREGNLFSAYTSTDGSTWSLVGTDTIAMPATVYVGLAVTSHNATAQATATFSNVAISTPTSSNKPPTVSISSPASGASYTAPANVAITATAGDADGSVTRIDFFAGTQPVGSDTTSPFSTTWTGAPAGTYVLKAVATDNAGATTTSLPINVTVTAPTNQPPTVSISSPASGTSYTAPATITITATASDPNGSVTKVDFLAGSQIVGSDTTSPFSFTWTGAPAGTYTLTAVATDNAGATTTSLPINVTVTAPTNQPPTVSISSPASGTSYTAPATITISAAASDPNGSVTKVDFFAGTQLLGWDTTSPFSFTWTNVSAGTYALTAVATDNAGATTTSLPINVTVTAPTNQPPTVSISSPASGASYTAPATIAISATASDPNGSVTKVDFFAGTQLLGWDTTSPFSFTWTNVSAGTYVLKAVATDNAGATATSALINVTVAAAGPAPIQSATLYFSPADYDTLVSSCTVVVKRASDGAIMFTQNLGKPPAVGGEISVDLTTLVAPLPSGSYYAVVTAIGPGGSTPSSPSPVFVR